MLEVIDEGRGIDEQKRATIDAGAAIGVGFRGMQERVKLIGGKLKVQSSDRGTSVIVTLPVIWHTNPLHDSNLL
jgi:signal transduction histidine kinase